MYQLVSDTKKYVSSEEYSSGVVPRGGGGGGGGVLGEDVPLPSPPPPSKPWCKMKRHRNEGVFFLGAKKVGTELGNLTKKCANYVHIGFLTGWRWWGWAGVDPRFSSPSSVAIW